MRLSWLRFAIVVALVIPAACNAGTQDGGIVVFAASSLTDVLEELDADVDYQFAGSDELALQITEGARADVFVSADESYVRDLHEAGSVDEPVPIATNRLVLVVPSANPAGIDTLEDAAAPGVKVVVGAPGVPVGDYTRQMLAALGLDDVLANVVSNEEDVRAVLGKVALGEADAGFVYATDVGAVDEDVRVIEPPESAQPRIVYAAAVVPSGDDLQRARAFIERLTGEQGRRLLQDAGFGLP
ncbi:MAG: molybdate ABC transporter substrate-binding protein [Actinomycetota bacterium]